MVRITKYQQKSPFPVHMYASAHHPFTYILLLERHRQQLQHCTPDEQTRTRRHHSCQEPYTEHTEHQNLRTPCERENVDVTHHRHGTQTLNITGGWSRQTTKWMPLDHDQYNDAMASPIHRCFKMDAFNFSNLYRPWDMSPNKGSLSCFDMSYVDLTYIITLRLLC